MTALMLNRRPSRALAALPPSMGTYIPITAIALTCFRFSHVSAAVVCNNTATCESLLRPGSECVDGKCSNPFERGCFRQILGEDGAVGLRSCNSDDPPGAAELGICSESVFDYPEIRISNGNWESSIFITWVLQIILSELVGVPVTVETGKRDVSTGERIDGANSNFYNPNMDFTYAAHTYNWDGIKEAHRVGDCRTTQKDCCHVMPEVWSGQVAEMNRAVRDGYVEPAASLDIVGKLGIYVPRFTATRDPSLTSMLGLSDESNRAKLAKTFKRPTTWAQYCAEVSPTACDEENYDGVARRQPVDDEEGSKFYVEDYFRGHFRYTAKNDCNKFPKNCTGHFVDPICEWSTYTQGQIFWNNIALESDGTVPPYGSYTWSEMIQIWTAANETQEDVIMYWWRPDWVPHVFRGGPGEFVPVTLAEPSEECALARIDTEAKCSTNVTVRRGTAEGACDYEPYVLKKVLTSSLRRSTQDTEEVNRSPAYELIRAFRMTDLVVDMMLRRWIARGVDKYGYDPREVVCDWVAQNLEQLRQFVPEGYPRKIVQDSLYEKGYLNAAMGVGAFTICVTMMTAVVTYCIRHRRIIRYAQPLFLMLILLGFLLVATGAVLFATEPSRASCVIRQWLIMLGYSLELIPLITKIAAINKMMQHAKKLKRVQVEKKRLLGVVAMVIVLVLVYLSVWTAIDPPTRQEERVLTGKLTEDNEAYVAVRVECSSSSNGWAIAAMGWQVVLLLCATVLGFQSRNVRQDFNESQRLAFMVYSHFFFVTMRLITHFLSDIIQPNVLAGVTSFLLSLDTLVTLLIYFLPKFWEAIFPKTMDPPLSDAEAIRRRSSLPSSNLNGSGQFEPPLFNPVAFLRRSSRRSSNSLNLSGLTAEERIDTQKHQVYSTSSGMLAENHPNDESDSPQFSNGALEMRPKKETGAGKNDELTSEEDSNNRQLSIGGGSQGVLQDSVSSLHEVRFEDDEPHLSQCL